jgi:hypothetical protein
VHRPRCSGINWMPKVFVAKFFQTSKKVSRRPCG